MYKRRWLEKTSLYGVLQEPFTANSLFGEPHMINTQYDLTMQRKFSPIHKRLPMNITWPKSELKT